MVNYCGVGSGIDANISGLPSLTVATAGELHDRVRSSPHLASFAETLTQTTSSLLAFSSCQQLPWAEAELWAARKAALEANGDV